MTALRIAAQTCCFSQPFRKALHIAATIGCEGVQIDARQELRPAEITDTGLREVRKMLADLNLRVGSVAFPTRRGYADPTELDRRVEATIAAMQLASKLGARVLVCNLGSLPGAAAEAPRALLVEVIASLAERGMKLGVQLAAQISCDDLAQVADFIAQLPEGTLFLDLHPPQIMAEGHSPQKFVGELGGHVAHVYAVDAVRDLSAGRNREVELGRGSTDFPAILGQLEEFGYAGWVTIQRTGSQQTVEDFANAVKFLRAI